MSNKANVVSLVAAGVLSWGVTVSHADTTSTADAAKKPDDAGSGVLDEVVVTAQFVSQTVQKVPAAVTALDADTLQKMGATSLVLAAQEVPSLRIEPLRGGTQIFLRGVGQTLTGVNSDPAVAVNVNGVYVPGEMSGASFFDVERIEVLPGPQGTLYGRNATGGVINVVTRTPGKEFGSDGYFEVGNYGRTQVSSGVDLPVTEDFGLRGAINYIHHQGYFSNGMDDQDSMSGRLTSVWKPQDGTVVTGIASYAHDGGYGQGEQNIPPPGPWRFLAYDPRALNYSNDVNTRNASLTVVHDFNESVKLTYIGGYNRIDLFQNTAAWPGPPPAGLVTDLYTRAISQELRMNASWDRWQAVLGGYYFNIKSNSSGEVLLPSPNPARDYASTTAFLLKNHGEAVFGQATYSVLDDLRLTGGVRYTATRRDMTGDILTTIGGTTAPAVLFAGERSDDHVDWRGGIEYDLTSTSLVYANVATGFTPGGFSTAQEVRGQPEAAPFNPVTLTAYTVGTKNRFGGWLTVNLEGFYYDYKNYQVSARNPLTGANNVYNAAKAEVYGVQLDTVMKLSRVDTVTLSAAPMHAVAVRLTTPSGVFDGDYLPYAPNLTANGSYAHTFGLSNGADVVALINSQFVSGRWGNYAHAAGSYIGTDTESNANLTYTTASGRFSFGAWVRNIENHNVPSVGIVGAIPGPGAYYLEPPRTYGASFAYNFLGASHSR